MFNPFQRTCANAYSKGEFAHVAEIEQLRAMRDTLFTFLIIELGITGDCDTREDWRSGLETSRMLPLH